MRGGSVQLAPTDDFVEDEDYGRGARGGDLFGQPSKTRITVSQPTAEPWNEMEMDWPPRNIGNSLQGLSRGKGRFSSRHGSHAQEDDISWDPELDKDNDSLLPPNTEKKQYAREEKRTIIAKNLSERAIHKDIIEFLRGGLVLDVYLRSNDRSASISFVEGSAAQDFMNYVKRKDIYVHSKRVCPYLKKISGEKLLRRIQVEFTWNDRQFILPGHVANKIGIGATRNLIIRNVHPNITEERIRQDLDHIHNLVIIDILFRSGDAYLQLNSIHNSLFARTCMMSRATYKGMRIEWYPDACAQPLPKLYFPPRKENTATPPLKKANAMMNRFQMLNLDGEGTEDSSEDDNEPSILTDVPVMHISHSSPWNTSTVAA